MSDQPEPAPQPEKTGNEGMEEGSKNFTSRGINPPQRQSFKVRGVQLTSSNSTGQLDSNPPQNLLGSQTNSPQPKNDNQDTNNNSNSNNGKGGGDSAPHPGEGGSTVHRGTRPGDRYVRIIRTTPADVQRIAPQYVQLSEESLKRGGKVGLLKQLLIGRPIATAQSHHQRLSKVKALAIFASDALSSVAYATEATMFVLVTAVSSSQPLANVIPISIVICILIALVVNSYRQTVAAYPGGGGSYIVSKDNLGVNAGLVAAAAILIDYTLTVAVSVAAGVAAITSAIPALNGNQVVMGVILILFIMLVNLRGIKESGTVFAIPTYLFIISFLTMLGFGVFKVLTGDYTQINPPGAIKTSTTEIAGFNSQPLTIFLLLQAFAAGCAALTGTEAISDGVQAFRKPEPRNAATTLMIMGGLLITFFLGTSFLAYNLNALPDDPNSKEYETVISEIGRYLFGGNSPLYYILQASTALILILAANTAFADFPRLSYFLARDKFLPNIFASRGDRLAYSTGIIVLAVLACTILAIFNGHTESLIPLYAVGVFLAFTLSQTSMVIHWQKEKRKGIRGVEKSQIFNAIGAVSTGIVLIILVLTKFLEGAWLVVLLIPLIFLMFKAINRHYNLVTNQLQVPASGKVKDVVQDLPINGARKHTIIVPVSRINKVTLASLDFAKSLGDDVTALFISDEPGDIEKMTGEWGAYDLRIPLVILENPYRSIVPPLLNYIAEVDNKDSDDVLMVVLPEFVAVHWWEHILHNQTALRIKSTLLFRPGVVVIDVPYHLKRNENK